MDLLVRVVTQIFNQHAPQKVAGWAFWHFQANFATKMSYYESLTLEEQQFAAVKNENGKEFHIYSHLYAESCCTAC